MDLNKDFTYYLSSATILEVAQNIYDSGNFSGFNEDQRKILEACKRDYLKLTGNELPLTYNCPA